MNRTAQSSRILLLAGRPTPSTPGSAVIQRYRLARARLDGRATPAQRSAGELAASKRVASLFIP
jgi:hypothetical protein